MEYICSVCKKRISGGLVALQDHTDEHIIDLLKADHPDWVEADGICQKCLDHYRGQLRGMATADRQRTNTGLWTKLKRIFKNE